MLKQFKQTGSSRILANVFVLNLTLEYFDYKLYEIVGEFTIEFHSVIKMVPMCIKSFFVSCFILSVVQFRNVQLKPDIWSSFAIGINTFANSMVKAVVNPYSETLSFIKSQTTNDLCKRNTVRY